MEIRMLGGGGNKYLITGNCGVTNVFKISTPEKLLRNATNAGTSIAVLVF